MTERTVLILSPHFPPSSLAGVHRARHMAKHLPAHGWRPIVLSADPSQYAEAGDPALAALVPDTVRQVRTRALPAGLCRLAGIGDIGLRGYPYFAAALDRIARQDRPAVVFITGSPFYPLLLAERVKRQFAIPVVLDLQDPWVSAFGATRPRWSKGGMAHSLAVTLEPRAVRHADFVTSVSETQNQEMAQRYPWLDAARMAAIPIGGDPDDFAALAAAPPGARAVPMDAASLNFSYVGTCLPRAEPLVRELFAAVAELRARQPGLAQRLRFNFVGTSNRVDGHDAYAVRDLARAAGVADLVRETPQRVPFLDALSVLARSHAVMMIGSDEPHYTASKIYPALMSGRPFLSLFHARSSAHDILSSAGGGRTFAFDTPADLAALAGPLSEAIEGLATDPGAVGRVSPASYAPYTAHAVAERFAAIFGSLGERR